MVRFTALLTMLVLVASAIHGDSVQGLKRW